MLWLLISGFFLWMVFREFRLRVVPRRGYDTPLNTPVSKIFVACLLIAALAFAWPPLRYWRLERTLVQKARIIAPGRPVSVHCNTIFDTFFDSNSLLAGHVNMETGEIVLQYPYCEELLGYLAHPAKASPKEIVALHIFTHEAMHVRGESNEAATECQAVQRNYRVAKMFGVSDAVALRNAKAYYQRNYLRRNNGQGFNAVYFSTECAPGGALDERLSDSLWTMP